VTAQGTLAAQLRMVQNELFVIGSHLGSPDEHGNASLPPLEDSGAARLEMEIDAPRRNWIACGISFCPAEARPAPACIWPARFAAAPSVWWSFLA